MGSPKPSTPTPPPEAVLIRIAREARGLSLDQAAAMTPIRLSGARWRQLERGYETPTKPVIAPDRTLAHMAYVVGVTPERLDEAGRGIAADILREILRQAPAPGDPAPYADLADENERTVWGLRLPEETRREMVDAIRRFKSRMQQEG